MHACETVTEDCHLRTTSFGIRLRFRAELRDKIWILLSRPSGLLVAAPVRPNFWEIFLADRAARPVRCGDADSRHHASPSSDLASQ